MGKGINVEFEQLSYRVKCGTFRKTEKTVLNQINGNFRECELSVIMGPSGSGKSSLLNVLTGFAAHNGSGSIKINGSTQNNQMIRNQSAYIMQDQTLYPLLTVRESMRFAIKFKTGTRMSALQQNEKIDSILKQLGLNDTLETHVKNLSGGQQKRLSIAIELVDDPRILFLDEPTTGLDSSASSLCVQLLKRLAQEGKTIICTIHTPSALLFQMFDQLYVLAEGNCIYQGASKNVVPFLADLNLVCPASYNPADYLLEISTNDYGYHNCRLSAWIKNGRNEAYRSKSEFTDVKPPKNNFEAIDSSKHSSTFCFQLFLLIQRNFIFMKRDRNFVTIRLVVSLIMGLLVGFLFYGIGNLGNHVFDNYKYVFVTTHFLTYASYFSLMVRFPLDLPILRREHFNRWYSTGSYYLALSLSDYPVLIVFSLIYNLIAYFMTGQPLDGNRFMLVIGISFVLCFVAQVFGLFAGSMFGLTFTLILAMIIMMFHVIFAGVLVLKKDAQPWMKWIFEINFLKHANDGITEAIFGYRRGKLECEEMYCHFRNPQTFMRMIDAPENTLKVFFVFPLIFVLMHVWTFINMNNRLKRAN